MSGKELTIEEVIEEMGKLKIRYYDIAHRLRINFAKIRLRSVVPKDIMVKGGRRTNDKILLSIAEQDDLRTELSEVKKAYYSYKDLLIELIWEKEKKSTKEEMIQFYKEKMHYSYDEIAVLIGYSKRQVQRIYKELKDVTQCH